MDRASRVRAAIARAGESWSRIWPALATVGAGAGVALVPGTASAVRCIPSGSSVFCFPDTAPTVFRTGGAVAQAWALGTLTEAVRPDTGGACDLSGVCDLIVTSDGTQPGTGFTIHREFATGDFVFPGNLPFTMDEVIDYTHPSANGAGGSCYPATGKVAITVGTSGTLVLDFQGQACQLGKRETQALLFNGGYIGDPASTGSFAAAQAIGSFTIENPSGLPGGFTQGKISLNGQLLLQGEPPPQ